MGSCCGKSETSAVRTPLVKGESRPERAARARELAASGDLQGARAIREQLVKEYTKIDGRKHENTLTVIGDLATTIAEQGDHVGARALRQEVFDLRRQLYGPRDPRTITAMNNLALSLSALKDFSGAKAFQEEILTARRAAGGPRTRPRWSPWHPQQRRIS